MTKTNPALMGPAELVAHAHAEYGVELDVQEGKKKLLARLHMLREGLPAYPEVVEAEGAELSRSEYQALIQPDRERSRGPKAITTYAAGLGPVAEASAPRNFKLVKVAHEDGTTWDVQEPHPEVMGLWITNYRSAVIGSMYDGRKITDDEAKEQAQRRVYFLDERRKEQSQEMGADYRSRRIQSLERELEKLKTA